MRATLLAKHVTATRPFAAAMASVSPSRASDSEPVCPSTMALVESPTIASTPSSPSLPSRSLSVSMPRTGVLSNFQSPVCKTVPASVRIAKAAGSGIEWFRPIISISNAPIFSTAFIPISCNGISKSFRDSASLRRSNARVKALPHIGQPRLLQRYGMAPR